MMNKGLVHANIKHNWRTPDSVFDPLHKIFKFDVDLMATAEDTKLLDYVPEIRELTESKVKGRSCWINPPYGKDLYWVIPLVGIIAQHADYVVCLLPMSTDLEWYSGSVIGKAYQFIRRGRIKFDPPVGVEIKRNAPSHGNLLAVYVGPFTKDFGYLRRMLAQETEWREILPPEYSG